MCHTEHTSDNENKQNVKRIKSENNDLPVDPPAIGNSDLPNINQKSIMEMKIIGRGGFGSVYSCKVKINNNYVIAVAKIYNKLDDKSKYMMEREIEVNKELIGIKGIP